MLLRNCDLPWSTSLVTATGVDEPPFFRAQKWMNFTPRGDGARVKVDCARNSMRPEGRRVVARNFHEEISIGAEELLGGGKFLVRAREWRESFAPWQAW